MSPSDAPLEPELPTELADALADRILAVGRSERDEVLRALIASHPQHAGAIRRLSVDLAGAERLLDSTAIGASAPSMPATIGRYRVVSKLGEGAFGTVFLCQQDEPVRRAVAIKVLRPGAGDRHTLTRFELERQMLARLNHPSIATLFDAGALPDGRPYFVMEHVDGEPIRRFCEERAYTVERRLLLFLDVCRGVEHAHRRGIVHRDLKPANVLVVETEAGALPKIIDFGIAKALEAWGGTSGVHTETGRVVGTPGYMSPEQAASRLDEIDARSDVFSLGVMLYELLTGDLPWQRGAAATDAEPPRPSSRVAFDSKGAVREPTTGSSSTLQASPSLRRQLVASLRGDLDWITLTALARERERRYGSVAELIADLERHRQGLPIHAGPPSATYRLRKFAHRHRAAVRSAVAIAAILVVAVVVGHQLERKADAKVADAKAETETALGGIGDVLRSMLARANQAREQNTPEGDALRKALLDEAVALYDRLVGIRPGDPALRDGRCRALGQLSRVHWLLGGFARAVSIAGEAVQQAQELVDGEPGHVVHRALLASMHRQKAYCLFFTSRYEEAHAAYAAAVAEYDLPFAQARGKYGPEFAEALRGVAMALERIAPQDLEALELTRRAEQVLEAVRSEQPDALPVLRQLVLARTGHATAAIRFERFDDAERALRAAAADLPALQPDEEAPRCTAQVNSLLARVAIARGDDRAAVDWQQAAVAAGEQWVEREPKRLLARSNSMRWLWELGELEGCLGAWDKALPRLLRAIALHDAIVRDFPEDRSEYLTFSVRLFTIVETVLQRGTRSDLEHAERWARRALALFEERSGAPGSHASPLRWPAMVLIARVLAAQGGEAAEVSAAWEEVAAGIAAASPDAASARQAWLGIARARLRAGALAEAGAALERVREFGVAAAPQSDAAVEGRVLEGLLAAARGEHAAAAAAGEAILAGAVEARRRQRAADCLRAAWRAAEAGEREQEVARRYRERAAEVYRALVDEHVARGPEGGEDVDAVLVWGFSSLALAVLEGRGGERAQRALTVLEALRERVHGERWDQELLEEARALAK